MNETLANLYRQAGLQPAWQRQPEAQPGYTPPRPRPRQMRPAIQRLYDPNQGVRDQAGAQVRQERELAALTDRAMGGYSGYADRNQVEEFGRGAMEMTGAPAWARGIQDVQNGRPGEAIPEFLMGALNTAGIATLPLGGGARAPPRPMARPMLPEPAPIAEPLPLPQRPQPVAAAPDAGQAVEGTSFTGANLSPEIRAVIDDHFGAGMSEVALRDTTGSTMMQWARELMNETDSAEALAAVASMEEWAMAQRAQPAGMRNVTPDGGPVQAGRDADGAALDLDRLKAEGWDTSRAWSRVVPDTAADPWEVRPLGRFGPGLYFGDDVVEGQMTSRVNRIGARQGHNAASHRAYIRDGDMATDAEWREAYRRHSKGPLGERNPRDAEQRAVRDLEQRGFIGVVVRDRNDGSMSLNVFRRENILPVPTDGRSGPNAGPSRPPPRPRPPPRRQQ